MHTSFYFVSLTLLVAVFLFFVALGGVFTAYLYAFLGDKQALENDYGSLNPFNHIDLFWIIIFLLTKIFVRKGIPFNYEWKNGTRGFIQKFLFIFALPIFHLIITSGILTTGIIFFGKSIGLLAMQIPLSPSNKLIYVIKEIWGEHCSGMSVIFIALIIYAIVTNIFLCIVDFFINCFDFLFRMFVFIQSPNDIRIAFLYFLVIAVIFSIYGSTFFNACWKTVYIFPKFFLKNKIGID